MATSRSLSCEPGNWTSPCTFLPCSSPFLPTATLIPFFWAAFPERYISAVPGLRTQPVLCTNKMVCFAVHFLGVFVFFSFVCLHMEPKILKTWNLITLTPFIIVCLSLFTPFPLSTVPTWIVLYLCAWPRACAGSSRTRRMVGYNFHHPIRILQFCVLRSIFWSVGFFHVLNIRCW